MGELCLLSEFKILNAYLKTMTRALYISIFNFSKIEG